MNKSIWENISFAGIAGETETNISWSPTINLDDTVQFAITCQSGNAANVTYPMRINLYANIADSDWNISADTDPYASFDNISSGNVVKRRTVPISPDPKYVRIRLQNRNVAGKNISDARIWVTQGEI